LKGDTGICRRKGGSTKETTKITAGEWELKSKREKKQVMQIKRKGGERLCQERES